MTEPYTQILEDDDEEPGIHRRTLATALGCWIGMNGGRRTVAEAALVFNTTQALIQQAIEDHYWLFKAWRAEMTDPTQQWIEEDGE